MPEAEPMGAALELDPPQEASSGKSAIKAVTARRRGIRKQNIK